MDAIHEVVEAGLKYFFDILLLDDLACEGLFVVFILVGFVGGCEPPSAQALIHFDEIASHLFVLLLHINNIKQIFDIAFQPKFIGNSFEACFGVFKIVY